MIEFLSKIDHKGHLKKQRAARELELRKNVSMGMHEMLRVEIKLQFDKREPRQHTAHS